MSVYLITGAANGLGAVIAARLSGAGNSIMLAGMEKAQLPGVRSVICDVTDAAQIASLMKGLEAVEGRLDGLVCHAGAESAAQVINAASGLLRAGRGTAIAIGSNGMPAMTRALARDLGPQIRVNWLAETAHGIAQQAHEMLDAGRMAEI